jgi:hypothetical protein
VVTDSKISLLGAGTGSGFSPANDIYGSTSPEDAVMSLQILSLDEMRALPSDLSVGGLYFLWRGNELQYIGQTNNVRKRLWAHRHVGRIEFDAVTVLRSTLVAGSILAAETTYILAYLPPMNAVPTALDPTKKTCRYGHSLTADNTETIFDGYRRCRICYVAAMDKRDKDLKAEREENYRDRAMVRYAKSRLPKVMTTAQLRAMTK